MAVKDVSVRSMDDDSWQEIKEHAKNHHYGSIAEYLRTLAVPFDIQSIPRLDGLNFIKVDGDLIATRKGNVLTSKVKSGEQLTLMEAVNFIGHQILAQQTSMLLYVSVIDVLYTLVYKCDHIDCVYVQNDVLDKY